MVLGLSLSTVPLVQKLLKTTSTDQLKVRTTKLKFFCFFFFVVVEKKNSINTTISTKYISDDASSAQKWLKAGRGCSFSPANQKGLHSVTIHPRPTPSTVHKNKQKKNLFRLKEREETFYFSPF